MRIGSIRYEERKNGFDMMPILKKSVGQLATLHCHHTRIDTLQKKFCSAANTEGMAWHLRETCCNPYCIAMVLEPMFGQRSPTSICSLKGEER